jgi:hypothetical protein
MKELEIGAQGFTSVTSAWISDTCRARREVAVRSGSCPDNPLVVDHDTFHRVVTDTANVPPGCDVDDAAV